VYREDEPAHAARAGALIDEIATLERQKLARTHADRRLEEARHELAALQPASPPPAASSAPGPIAHALVFLVTAGAAFVAYGLAF
jgi:hypothetical protein